MQNDLENQESESLSIKNVWEEINEEFERKRAELLEYKKRKTNICDVPTNPVIQFMDKEVFKLLLPILETTIFRAMEANIIKCQKSTFNGIDFISEMLWNLNPRYPERESNWKYIFDMDWVIEYLQEQWNPRPYFPFSWIWTKEYAVTKIQAYMRGYWARIRPDVQEVRQFWKDYYSRRYSSISAQEVRSNTSEVKVIYLK